MRRALIVEDDQSIGPLLVQLIRRLWPQAVVEHCVDGRSALDAWRRHGGADLVLLDWGLPDTTGTALLKTIRATGRKAVCVMVSGHADRDRIIEARRLQADAYIVKPFRAAEMMARLREVVDASGAVTAVTAANDDLEALPAFVSRMLEHELLGVPLDPALAEALEGMADLDAEARLKLMRRCQFEPALVGPLLGLANSSPYNDGSVLIETPASALERVGSTVLVNIAVTAALHAGSALDAEVLVAHERRLRQESLALVRLLNVLGRALRVDVAGCRAAAMLTRLGELALLVLQQRWVDLGGRLDPSACERLLAGCAAETGHQLKVQWGIPTALQMRIGAVYQLPSGTVHRDTILMRIVGLVHGERDGDELNRLLSRLGIEQTPQRLRAQAAELGD
ncbi:histidine kinase [Marichromatium purpuratum 984]|uniref:Histidine kinase n=1 Tax=Marichromatium purpuratum 984 TaxID=765910 RepID=W0E3R2_MARPU|nr:response regulator [Marichromatium purpuratum]AHF03854.1 histidine kinase [Marichromatium purpuratum 984]